MLKVSLILLLSWNLVSILRETVVATAQDECTTNSDCDSHFGQFKHVCCKLKYNQNSARTCQEGSCLGRYCFTDGDCGGDRECCVCNRCTNDNYCPRCNTNFDCAYGEYCCKQVYFSGDAHYSVNVCRRSCVGEVCLFDTDCSGPAEYCNKEKKCAKSASSTIFPRWAIALLVSGGLGLAVILGMCLYCRRNFKKICQNNTNTEENGDTNIVVQVAKTCITPQTPNTSSSQYDHLDRRAEYETLKSPSKNNIKKAPSQTDSDGYELTEPR